MQCQARGVTDHDEKIKSRHERMRAQKRERERATEVGEKVASIKGINEFPDKGSTW